MTETTLNNRFALLFILYYLGVSFALSLFQPMHSLSDGAYMTIAQLLCFAPPILFYFLYTKKEVRKALRLNPLGWKNIFLITALAFAIQPIMSFLSFVMGLFFPNPVESSIDGLLASGFFLAMLSTAILPPILEELPTRGILLSGYRFLGEWKAALLSALLFAFLHMNPQQFPYAFLVGFLFCILVERTDSILASILPHCIINSTTVISVFLDPAAATMPVLDEATTTMLLFSSGLMALFSLPMLAFLLYLFLQLNPPKESIPLTTEDGAPYQEKAITPAFLAVFVLYFIFGLLPYFMM